MGFLTPGARVLGKLMNEFKLPLVSTIYLAPFGVALAAGIPLPLVAWLLIGLTLTLILYLVVCFYVQPRAGFAVFNAMVERISAGDLSVQVDGSIGGRMREALRALAQVSSNLGQIVSQVRSSAETIALTAKEITSGHANFSQRTEEQAATLAETAAGLEKLAATVKQNAGHCQAAGGLSKQCSSVAANSVSAVQRAVDRMSHIERGSKEIVDIVSVIDGIAFQTNILALNAAVEAVRARDQGRGFAVVAAEVRALAQRSAAAANEVKALIHDSVGDISAGTSMVSETGAIINEIVDSVRKADALIKDVATASREQSQGVSQITAAVTQLDGVAQQNAGLVEETTAAMVAFQQETDRLIRLVKRFQVGQVSVQDSPAASSNARFTLLQPGLSLMRALRVDTKYPLLFLAHQCPLVLVGYFSWDAWTSVAITLIGVTVLIAAYTLLAFMSQTKGDFAVLLEMLRRVSEGDLTAQVDSRIGGQLGDALQAVGRINDNLGQVVSQVRVSAESIALTAKEITAGHISFSQRTEQQAATLEETAAGLEQLAATVKQNADNCHAASTLSAKSTKVASGGARTVHKAVDRMAVIESSSKQIVDIIAVIDGIAFQTNILALNAAVEAARAGEQGRGFAVVATEVRALAQRSAKAAKEIKTLIQDSVGNIAEGAKLVNDAGAVINDIVNSVEKASQLVAEVASASREQSEGISHISTAITQLDGMAQQNAGLVEQTTAAMVAFQQETTNLIDVVQRFKVAEGGQRRAQPARPAGRPKLRAFAPAPMKPIQTQPQLKTLQAERARLRLAGAADMHRSDFWAHNA